MGKRRKAREMAMQALYYMDVGNDVSHDAIRLYVQCFRPSENVGSFFEDLAAGVVDNWSRINEIIERFSSNWKLNRMSCVDRNILRIAVFELVFCPDIPPKVSINEAIDIGKKYGTEESGAFINGILDSIRQALEKGEAVQEFGGFLSGENKIGT